VNEENGPAAEEKDKEESETQLIDSSDSSVKQATFRLKNPPQ